LYVKGDLELRAQVQSAIEERRHPPNRSPSPW
jgi:hypothetical protein